MPEIFTKTKGKFTVERYQINERKEIKKDKRAR